MGRERHNISINGKVWKRLERASEREDIPISRIIERLAKKKLII